MVRAWDERLQFLGVVEPVARKGDCSSAFRYMAAMHQPRVRVLHVAHSLGMGGTEKVLQLFVTHLDSARYQPVVFAFAGGERRALLRAAGIPVVVGGKDGGLDLFKLLGRFQPHIVHVHRAGWEDPVLMRPVFLHCMARGQRSDVPKVVETNVFGRRDVSATGALIDRHLFVSRFCARRYSLDHGVDVQTPHYGVLYNPVDTDFYAAACPDRAPPWPPVIGRLSRPDPGKWSAYAWEMFPPVLQAVPEVRYRIIGMLDSVRTWFAQQQVAGAVEPMEPVVQEAKLAAFFQGLSLLAHANDTGESFGLVIAEAMAAGLPVVTHLCPGAKDNAQVELVEDGRTGFVATSVAQYAQAVIALLQQPALAQQMGQAGRARAQRLFRAQDIAAQLAAHYEELLDGYSLV